mgnify:CR=1 FL=1
MRITFGWDKKNSPLPLKIAHTDPGAAAVLADRLKACIQHAQSRDLVVVCIGTDRSTGDALGPLVGTHLVRACRDLHVYGTLSEPVHAMNLTETMNRIALEHRNPYIIAVDACLGQIASVGTIQFFHGPLRPGAGVHKDLPAVGDVHITGVVNVGGFMEYFVLQNTRLSLVFAMAEVIAESLARAVVRPSAAESPAARRNGSLPFPRA